MIVDTKSILRKRKDTNAEQGMILRSPQDDTGENENENGKKGNPIMTFALYSSASAPPDPAPKTSAPAPLLLV